MEARHYRHLRAEPAEDAPAAKSGSGGFLLWGALAVVAAFVVVVCILWLMGGKAVEKPSPAAPATPAPRTAAPARPAENNPAPPAAKDTQDRWVLPDVPDQPDAPAENASAEPQAKPAAHEMSAQETKDDEVVDKILRLRRAAEGGDPVTQFNLAMHYRLGDDLPQDDAKAAEWFRRSAEQGDAVAQFNMGALAAEGRGLARDLYRAAEWFRLAAEQGHPAALFNCGVLLFNGEGVARGRNAALACFRKAAEAGYQDAVNLLRRLSDDQGSGSLNIGDFDQSPYPADAPQDTQGLAGGISFPVWSE